MNDTPLHRTQKLCELFQKKTPSERYMMGWSMLLTSKFLITRSILEENPHCSQIELKKELFLRFYSTDFSEEQKIKILDHLSKLIC